MNGLDIAILLAAAASFVGGYRSGLIVRVATVLGIVAGVVLASSKLGTLSRWIDPEATRGPGVVVAAVAGGAFVGRMIGVLSGRALQRRLPTRPLRWLNRVGGGALGAAGVIGVVWLVTPLFAFVPGWPAEAARGSVVARTVANRIPAQLDVVASAHRILESGRLPDVFATIQKSPAGTVPTEMVVAPETVAEASTGVGRVVARGCRSIAAGTAFAVSPRGMVTNAHVVAGADSVVVEPDLGAGRTGTAVRARVVGFDATRDLAFLRLDRAAGLRMLDIADSEATPVGAAAVLGHPKGGPLAARPVTISEIVDADGRDIYDERAAQRNVAVLAASLAHGDSGSPIVNRSGDVIAVVFAIAPDQPTTGYALSLAELRGFLDTIPSRPIDAVDTGRCLG